MPQDGRGASRGKRGRVLPRPQGALHPTHSHLRGPVPGPPAAQAGHDPAGPSSPILLRPRLQSGPMAPPPPPAAPCSSQPALEDGLAGGGRLASGRAGSAHKGSVREPAPCVPPSSPLKTQIHGNGDLNSSFPLPRRQQVPIVRLPALPLPALPPSLPPAGQHPAGGKWPGACSPKLAAALGLPKNQGSVAPNLPQGLPQAPDTEGPNGVSQRGQGTTIVLTSEDPRAVQAEAAAPGTI